MKNTQEGDKENCDKENTTTTWPVTVHLQMYRGIAVYDVDVAHSQSEVNQIYMEQPLGVWHHMIMFILFFSGLFSCIILLFVWCG